jgi:ATP-dependent Zn protease
MPSPTASATLPFVDSHYLNREVQLDELNDLTDQELRLLATEMDGQREECSKSITRLMATNRPYGLQEKLTRVAGRFIHAIGQEQAARQLDRSFVEMRQQLEAVKAERNLLRQLLTEYKVAK